MALSTFSSFYYGQVVDVRNNILNFNEGFGEEAAEIQINSYTPTDIAIATQTALNVIGSLTYNVTFNRSDKTFTISADGPFDLLISSGSQFGVSIFPTLGFTGPDLIGQTSYTGNLPGPSEYIPQFILQDYKNKDMLKNRVAASINEAASGEIEVVSFGLRKFVEFSIKFITNKEILSHNFIINKTGFEDAVNFLTYLISKGQFEFMPDKEDPDNYNKLIVESLDSNTEGVGYQLKELVEIGLPDFYEINNIRCRVIE